jgi:hypothetical protein
MKSYFLFLVLLGTFSLFAEIRHITHLEEVFKTVRPDSLILMDLDETLIESSIMLGGKAWRRYAIDFLKTIYPAEKTQELYAEMTYWIAKRVPCVAVENSIHTHLKQMKREQIPIYGFTARGKKHWHIFPCPDGEQLAVLHLQQAGFDLKIFSESFFSQAFWSHPHFARGIFFTYPIKEKGTAALEIFADTRPKHVLFVDDVLSNIYSMEQAFAKLGIDCICFFYQHIDLYRSFDPLIAAIQLEKLYLQDKLLSDSEAMSLKQNYTGCDPNEFLLRFVDHLKKQ